MVYTCILSSPYRIKGILTILPLSFACLLCNVKLKDQHNTCMYLHALCILSCAFVLDYRIAVLWIIAFSIFSQRKKFPKTVGILWHTMNHTCIYYTWVAIDKMNEI